MAVPESRLILAHAHGPSFPQLLVYDVLARYPWWPRQVWIDISAVATMFADGPFAEHFSWVLGKVGADRVIFGSDYPLDDPLQAIQAASELGFGAAELEAIVHGNAAELIKK